MIVDNEKPLKDWTLGELQDRCNETSCKECFVPKRHGGLCGLNNPPWNWELEGPPRWTADDIEGAKAIKRLYPNTVKVERYKEADGMIKFICGGCYYTGHSGLLPGLALEECVALQEILDAETMKE